MTNPDLEQDETPFSAKRYFAHLIGWSVALSFVMIAGIVALVGFKHLLDEPTSADVLFALIGTPLAVIGGFFLLRTAPDFTMGEPNMPRGNRVRWLLVAIVIIGIAISLPISAHPEVGAEMLWSNSAMPSTPALLAGLMWALLMPFVIYFGRRNSDELVLAAHDFGMMVGFQFFSYAAPIWWIGWRGGFFPQPDVMIMFIACLILVSIANFWKRFA